MKIISSFITACLYFYNCSDPNGPNTHPWPAYDQQQRIQVLDYNIETKADLLQNDRAKFWMQGVKTEFHTLRTRLGIIKGIVRPVIGEGEVYEFRKIPYAQPPTATRRFKKPEPLNGSWTTTLDATVFGPSCLDPMSDRESNEDCLHLNIFVPVKIDLTSPRSVMIWIHGGAYVTGSALMYDGSVMALKGDVIIVTINYRLGPLGFFTTGDATLPGNYGLWDQHLAIKWVHDNIADYGGDPSSVTIFGESAGGGSASFQTLYPGNRGLFHRAIVMSGVATSFLLRANHSNIQPAADKYLQSVGCQSRNGEALVRCLQNLDTSTLLKTYNNYVSSQPCIDGDFVKGNAETLLQHTASEELKFFSSLDYMIGTLNGDGSIMVPLLLPPTVIRLFNTTYASGVNHDILCGYFAPFVASAYAPNKPSVVQELCQLYKNTTSIDTQSNALVDFLTDSIFTYPSLMSADFHFLKSNTMSTTYVYFMTRNNPIQTSIFPNWTYDWMTGASHSMDEIYLFNSSLLTTQPKDYDLANTMMSYWTNFAKTG